MTHKATRAAFGAAISIALKHMNKDREKGLLEIVDLAEKYMGDTFQKSSYDGARAMIARSGFQMDAVCKPPVGRGGSACGKDDGAELGL